MGLGLGSGLSLGFGLRAWIGVEYLLQFGIDRECHSCRHRGTDYIWRDPSLPEPQNSLTSNHDSEDLGGLATCSMRSGPELEPRLEQVERITEKSREGTCAGTWRKKIRVGLALQGCSG